MARENAEALGLADRVHISVSDWVSRVEGMFDLVVSNPPYIAASEMDGLSPEVRDHEPALALTDGDDGLTAYRAIVRTAPAHMSDGARLLLEIGAEQRQDVAALLRDAGFGEIGSRADMDGRPRVVTAIWPGSGANSRFFSRCGL